VLQVADHPLCAGEWLARGNVSRTRAAVPSRGSLRRIEFAGRDKRASATNADRSAGVVSGD